MNTQFRIVFAAALLASLGCSSSSAPAATPTVDLEVGPGRDGLIGWNIVGPKYEEPNPNDPVSFEWDYFMVHDESGRFTGSVGYLIANPRNAGVGGLGDLLPKGGNVAISGRFADGASLSTYKNFGLAEFSASGETRSFDAKDSTSGHFAKLTPVRATGADKDKLVLEGVTAQYEWNLTVTQAWTSLSTGTDTFAPMHGDDVGTLLKGEEWNVNMLWPRTRVSGWVKRLDTGEKVTVEGHGYRENSWGRWAFAAGGWDFAVVSDAASQVAWTWQSYHFKSVQLDYLDLAFVDDGALKLVQFKASAAQLGWEHHAWTFDKIARQCVPLDTTVVAQNAQYRVEAKVTLGDKQIAMLSDATPATKDYVIMTQFPTVEGTIRRIDGTEVASFSGQGGGEFSTARATSDNLSDAECNTWGKQFASPLP